MNRRDVFKMAGGVAISALSGVPDVVRAAPRPALELYRDAIVIDGNLVPPLGRAARLDAESAAEVRASGLTALKLTLGGSGNRSKTETDAAIAELDQAIELNRDLFIKVATAADFAAAKKVQRTGIIYSFEAAEMLEGRVENVDHFRSAGVLVMGLSYNLVTPFASGVLAPQSTGLTALGREAVHRMNALGVTVDLSHTDEPSSVGALAASGKPVLITHAGCAAVHPHPRNKSDALLRALAKNGGVLGIYELSYLVAPPAQPTLNDYLAHLGHALNVCGEDHVGIGTDGLLTPFDTSPESMKAWYREVERRTATGVAAPGEGPPPFAVGLNRPDRCAVIADALIKRGYSSRTVDKVLGRNFERVFEETWRVD
jgi:membrane dipeptidase